MLEILCLVKEYITCDILHKCINRDIYMDGLMTCVLRPFQQYFSRIRIIGGGGGGDYNERLCSMKPRLRLKRSPPQTGLEPLTATQ